MGIVRTVEDHLEQVLGLVKPLEMIEVPLVESRGLVLATDVTAAVGLPGFDNSAADGYAVRVAELVGAPLVLPVSADIPAGNGLPTALAPGTAARIMTGAPLPRGADGVVRVELTDGATDTVQIDEAVLAGTDIRWANSDTRPGDLALAAGTELTPARLGLLSGLGVTHVQVHRRPRVAVISTGSELTAPGEPLAPGSIYDSNSVLISSLLADANANLAAVFVLRDDIALAIPVFEQAAAGADLIVTTGGISAGAYEVVKDVLGPTKQVTFEQVAMQPGKPQGAGVFAGTPIVTLPGNPVSAFVSFQVFVAPVLRKLAGSANVTQPVHRGRLTESVTQHPQLRRYRRGLFDPNTGTAELVGGISSHYLASLARSNALLVIPTGEGELPAGTEIDVLPFAGS